MPYPRILTFSQGRHSFAPAAGKLLTPDLNDVNYNADMQKGSFRTEPRQFAR